MRRQNSIFNALLSIGLLLMLNSVSHAEESPNKKPITIAVISDGAANHHSLFIEELRTLSEGEFTLVFPPSKQVHGEWSNQKITKALQLLQQDEHVDMILALGWLASQAAVSTTAQKPTFAPLISNTKLLGLTPKGNSSGIKNINYLSAETQFSEELQAFQKVSPFTRLTLLIDHEIFSALPQLDQDMTAQASKMGVALNFVTSSTPSDELVAKIAENTEAVMIGPLPRLKREAKAALIEGLIKRKLLSYSWMSDLSVDEGILMSNHPASHWQRLARRNALNMQAVLRGEKTSQQPVYFEETPRIAINMSTARAINVSPCFDVIETALLLNDGPDMTCAPLDLQTVARTAIEQNLAIISGKLSTEISDKNIHEARSILFPKITANLSHFQVNADNPFVEIGLNPETRSQGALRLEQIIFSERALANLSIQKHLRIAQEAQQHALELDVVKNATSTYLSILIAQTQLGILKNNLKLTQAHLDLAKNRVRAGLANAAEIFRWESEIALTRQQVLKANSAVEKAHDTLNLILHTPIAERFAIQTATLNDPDLLMSQQSLLDLITNERQFELLSQFFVMEGLKASPRLAAIGSQMDAQKTQLSSEKRSYWAPNVALFGEVSEVFDERMIQSPLGLNVSLEDLTTWQAGINLSLPLFEGGGRQARIARSKLGLQQLSIQQQLTQEITEQEIRSRLHTIRASHPAISLSQQAALAAKQGYEIVKQNYMNGTLRVTDLLDAQTAQLAADQAAANATYTFLIDLMQLQYSVGQFDFFLTETQRQSTAKRLSDFIRNEE
jgi:outer membrane protein TolC/ABC-type uncharacterized transport system substrate-binding protein